MSKQVITLSDRAADRVKEIMAQAKEIAHPSPSKLKSMTFFS